MIQLTAAGRELLLRALSNTATINFLDVQFGNGSNAGASASALNNPLLTIGISRMTIDTPFVTLYTVFQNNTLASGFRRTETGVRAEDPDHPGTAMLFAYGYTAPESAEYIPADSEDGIESLYNIEVYIGDAENVTASISESVIYATKEELEALQSEVDNISKDSIGLGNVPNVSTNDQTPTYPEYTQWNTFPAYYGDHTGQYYTKLDHLVSGETLEESMSKLQAAVKYLIDHLGRYDNPHLATYSQVGAAAASHQHSANDVISGVLGVARGGTGNQDGTASKATKLATARTLKVNLESTSGASFDGSAAANIGVEGVLPASHGGTGFSSLDDLKNAIAGGTRCARIVIGTSTAGWVAKDCDYLCDGTADNVEIQAALDALPSTGGRIILLDGTYNIAGRPTLSKAHTEIIGVGNVKLNFQKYGDDISSFFQVNADDCGMSGLYLLGPSTTGYETNTLVAVGWYVSNKVNRFNFQGNTIEHGDIDLRGGGAGHTITGNRIGKNNGYTSGIYLGNCTDVIISGNHLDGPYYAIQASGVKQCTIANNVIINYQEAAIHIHSHSRGITITGNYIFSNKGGNVQALDIDYTNHAVITGNYFGGVEGADGLLVLIDDCDNFILVGNTMLSDYSTSVGRIKNCNKGIVRMNDIVAAAGVSSGFTTSGNTLVTISDNLISEYNSSSDI